MCEVIWAAQMLLSYSTKEETKAYEGKRLSRPLGNDLCRQDLNPGSTSSRASKLFQCRVVKAKNLLCYEKGNTDRGAMEARAEGLCHPSGPEANSGRGSREWSRSSARQPGP